MAFTIINHCFGVKKMNTNKKHPVISMTSVKSSQIHAIGHDPVTNTLAIQFKSKSGAGSVYHYQNFTPELFNEFKSAKSLGQHFKTSIKDAVKKHPFSKVK